MKLFSLSSFLLMLLVLAQPVLAAEETDYTNLPGWFAWLMVILAVGLPLLLLVYVRNKGQL